MAEVFHLIKPSSFATSWVMVASELSCGIGVILPSEISGECFEEKFSTDVGNFSVSEPVVSSGAIGIERTARMGPVSSPASICIKVTPVSVSPLKMANVMGDAPRKRGSKDACVLMDPCVGISKMACGKIRPYSRYDQQVRLVGAHSDFVRPHSAKCAVVPAAGCVPMQML